MNAQRHWPVLAAAQFQGAFSNPDSHRSAPAWLAHDKRPTRQARAARGGDCAAREERLRQSPYFYLRNLLCRYDQGVLTITGKVPYWQLRNFAESIVSRVDGVQQVANQVEVIDPQQPSIVAPALRNAG